MIRPVIHYLCLSELPILLDDCFIYAELLLLLRSVAGDRHKFGGLPRIVHWIQVVPVSYRPVYSFNGSFSLNSGNARDYLWNHILQHRLCFFKTIQKSVHSLTKFPFEFVALTVKVLDNQLLLFLFDVFLKPVVADVFTKQCRLLIYRYYRHLHLLLSLRYSLKIQLKAPHIAATHEFSSQIKIVRLIFGQLPQLLNHMDKSHRLLHLVLLRLKTCQHIAHRSSGVRVMAGYDWGIKERLFCLVHHSLDDLVLMVSDLIIVFFNGVFDGQSEEPGELSMILIIVT